MNFCSPSYFPAIHCCFACVSFHIPVLPFPPALPSIPRISRFVPNFSSQNPVDHARSRSLLQPTSPHPSTLSAYVLPFPPAFLFPVLSFVPVLPMLVPHFPSQNPVQHARSRSPFQRTSFPLTLPSRASRYCGFYLFCVYCAFLPLFFPNKMYLFFMICFLFIQCCFRFVIVKLDLSRVLYVTILARRPEKSLNK